MCPRTESSPLFPVLPLPVKGEDCVRLPSSPLSCASFREPPAPSPRETLTCQRRDTPHFCPPSPRTRLRRCRWLAFWLVRAWPTHFSESSLLHISHFLLLVHWLFPAPKNLRNPVKYLPPNRSCSIFLSFSLKPLCLGCHICGLDFQPHTPLSWPKFELLSVPVEILKYPTSAPEVF